MKSYYYVFNATTRAAPKVQHESKQSAVKEAERLARGQRGQRFEILKCEAFSFVPQTNVTFYFDDENSSKPKPRPEPKEDLYDYWA